jgi:hypothetical protein
VGQVSIEINAFDARWQRLDQLAAGPQYDVSEMTNDRAEQDCLENYGIEKPEWFTGLEADAREFFDTIGFPYLPPLYLLSEHKDLESINFDGRNVLAQAEMFNRYAFIKLRILEELRRSDGPVKAASLLVHELSHLTNDHTYVTVQLERPDKISDFHTKSGYVFGDSKQIRGQFLEEGFASYIAGLYIRSREQHDLSPTTITAGPAPYVPEHYRVMDDNLGRFSSETVTSPDGYAVEMLVWAVEQAGIMSSKELFDNLLAARRKSTEAPAMRKIIAAINAVQPGLYKKLGRLEYEKQNWEDGCALVYEAVTGNLWPEY